MALGPRDRCYFCCRGGDFILNPGFRIVKPDFYFLVVELP